MWKYRLEHVILFIGMKSAQRAQRRARIMKKRNVAVLAAAVGLMLTACGNPKGTADNRSDSAAVSTDTVENKAAEEETQEPEKLPASQDYVSSDGTYKVILLEGLTQTDMPLSAGCNMMGLDGDTARKDFLVFPSDALSPIFREIRAISKTLRHLRII